MSLHSKAETLYDSLLAELLKLENGDKFLPVRKIMDDFSVSQYTVDKAMDKLEEQGYISREHGKGIYVKSNGANRVVRIAFLAPAIQTPIYQELEEMLRACAKERGAALGRVNFNPGEDPLSCLPPGRYDAIAMMPEKGELSPDELYRLSRFDGPSVVIGAPLDDVSISSASGDPHLNGLMAASHLLRKGHRKTALLVSEPGDFPVIRKRAESFRLFIDAAGGECLEIDCGVKSGDYASEKTYSALSNFLKRGRPDFTAIYVLSDETALAAMRCFADNGLAVPGDISVIGTDGLRSGAFYTPPLTSIANDFAALAEKTVASLFDALAKPGGKPMKYAAPAFVLERGSVREINGR